ncbi:hypothetical protein F5X96DRAFT_637764 [Biscogniauxia mediterranea]|nr:hypothetical protein F5X96DRAFT_637764 [Biscogniauxia mediterranea]
MASDQLDPIIAAAAAATTTSSTTDNFSPDDLLSIQDSVGDDHFLNAFDNATSKSIVTQFVQNLARSQEKDTDKGAAQSNSTPGAFHRGDLRTQAIRLGLASLAAFLQANVTGPVLESPQTAEAVFSSAFEQVQQTRISSDGLSTGTKKSPIEEVRALAQRALDIDGVSVYPYIPHIELFCLARFIFTSGAILPTDPSNHPVALHLSWTRFRIHQWHYKLLAQPSLGPGSLYTKSGRWTDVATLEELIEKSLLEAEVSVLKTFKAGEEPTGEPVWPREYLVEFHLEEANCHILLGNDTKARRALKAATEISGFSYALSGALGKRTKFQENAISQLVVLAKSLHLNPEKNGDPNSARAAPAALPLNNDTLLESIEFIDKEVATDSTSSLPAQLQHMKPDDQPNLSPVDQIILLGEATIRDTFSPSDSLTSEEILPFAVRVIEDKAANWQVYTQALLVRSRIEMNRSRTIERGILQMQAVVDQVIVDTQEESEHPTENQKLPTTSDTPAIEVTSDNGTTHTSSVNKPTSFLPAPKPSESASPKTRLRYVNALASPPRWHLESELAYAWTSVGSLVSALEIFKRLRLWPEVALCLASTAASDDGQSGRGAGGEEKARAIVRWRLFHRTSDSTGTTDDDDLDTVDLDFSSLKASDFYGPERSPPPPNAPRLLCILGDMENDPQHYRRAWEISNHRFARAQKALGEFHLRNKEWDEAREAYSLAVHVNRLSPELWNRLGDIELRLGNFADAAEAFQRAISTANDTSGGEDARTWSNLGTALLSWYREIVQEGKVRQERMKNDDTDNLLDDMVSTKRAASLGKTASQLVRDSLIAYKRGATIADTNWQIWDNVITLASSLSPNPDFDDVILGVRNIIRIRKTEEAFDIDILTRLVREATKEAVPTIEGSQDVYEPPRGTIASKTVMLLENDIVPLITSRSECWALVSRIRAWRRDWIGALDAAEKGWRAAVGTGGMGSTLSASSGMQSQQGNWLTDAEAWDSVVQRTSELVAAYENYGSRVETIGAKWKGKARSAIRSVLSKAKEPWEGDERYGTLKSTLDDLR